MEAVRGMLTKGDVQAVAGVPSQLHELAPSTSPRAWQELDRYLKQRELITAVDRDKWTVLRLDCLSWDAFLRSLRDAGVLAERGGPDEAMRACCRVLMDDLAATAGYVHRGGIAIVCAPGQKLKKNQLETFQYKGRLQKWVSIASGLATSLLNRKLTELAAERGVNLSRPSLACFACHAGSYDTKDEAMTVVLLRAHACSTDCLLDACSYHGAPEEVQHGDFDGQLQWLHGAGALPLADHEAFGSLFVRSIGVFDAVHEQTGLNMKVNRTMNVHVNDGEDEAPKNLLNLFRHGLELMPATGEPRLAQREGRSWRFTSAEGKTLEEIRRLPSWGERERPKPKRDRWRGDGGDGKKRRPSGRPPPMQPKLLSLPPVQIGGGDGKDGGTGARPMPPAEDVDLRIRPEATETERTLGATLPPVPPWPPSPPVHEALPELRPLPRLPPQPPAGQS